MVQLPDQEMRKDPSADIAGHPSNAMRGCNPKHIDESRHLEDIPLYHFLGLGRTTNDVIELNLIGENHHLTHFFPSDKGHKYVTKFNPTLAYLQYLLRKMKGPSVLYLRGCEPLLQDHFPFKKFLTLTILEISNIANLATIPEEISEMTQLQSLNLSHLPIQHFPAHDFFSNLTKIHSLILKGCSSLQSLPSIEPLQELEMLDLSHCINLKNLRLQHSSLRVLCLSYTTLHCSIIDTKLTHVFCRDANGIVFESLRKAMSVQVLDLSGAQHLGRTLQFKAYPFLRALDLSRTSIESIDFLSPSDLLSILSLRECSSLVKLPAMYIMKHLEVLDISGCESVCDLPEDLCKLEDLKELNLSRCTRLRELREGVFDQMTCLDKLDLSETNFNHLPSFANLNDLGTYLILSRNLVEKVPHLSDLKNINLEIVGELASCETDEIGGGNIHPITCLVSNKANELHLVSTFSSNVSSFHRFKSKFKRVKNLFLEIQRNIQGTDVADFGRMLADLEYILVKIDLLENSDDNEGNTEKLLGDLMYAVEHLKYDDFTLNISKLKKLFHLVTKLKLLVPSPRLKQDSNNKRKDHQLTWKQEEETYDDLHIDLESNQHLHSSYESLTETQRKCLLYFAAIPRRVCLLEIKERNLIHLWYGEGFVVDPVEETGRKILEVLEQNKFLVRFSSRDWSMDRIVNDFVREKAKADHFFDFDDDPANNRVTTRLTISSKRACLLKSRPNLLSSTELWLNYTSSSQKLKCFNNIHTLLNVNERIINIKAEWFSKMKNLTVLHLGRWYNDNEEHMEAVDLKFLEELKNMKQLRVLSFEGIAAMWKLPDSICKLTNLKVLNLKECSSLEELPVGLGSLTDLAHLDVTNCPLLSMLPKGVKLLSKLEVLKGFLITYEPDGRQNKMACTLADLNKLQNLRNLILVVNIDKFPDTEDLEVFKEMKNLYKLKITWVRNNYIEQEGQKSLKHSKWWPPFKCQNVEIEQKPLLMGSNGGLENLKKLVLCCFPSETTPKWLHPSELCNLEKLYILGGHLKTLPGEPNQNTWNVKALRLKHVLKLDMDWELLRQIFPNMTYLQCSPDDYPATFPVDYNGEWRKIKDENKQER